MRYTTNILLFLLPILADITPQYYCLCCLSYQIYPHINTVSPASPVWYTPTILPFLLRIPSDITPQYYSFCCLSHQIYPHNITISAPYTVKGTSTAHWCLLHKDNFILYSVVLWNNWITNGHFSGAAEARFTRCILLWVSPLWVCTKFLNVYIINYFLKNWSFLKQKKTLFFFLESEVGIKFRNTVGNWFHSQLN